jgi:DNA-directed RNA polymerase alpha subunit
MLRTKLETILTDADKLIHAPPSKNEYEARLFIRQQNALADLKAQFEGVWSVLDACVAMPTSLRLPKEPLPAPPAPPPVNLYEQLKQVAPSISVDDCHFSLRAGHCLEELGIKTLGELSRHTASQLLNHRDFGETTLEEVEHVLKSAGLQLTADTPAPAVKTSTARNLVKPLKRKKRVNSG